jgi:hypothetical protein
MALALLSNNSPSSAIGSRKRDGQVVVKSLRHGAFFQWATATFANMPTGCNCVFKEQTTVSTTPTLESGSFVDATARVNEEERRWWHQKK